MNLLTPIAGFLIGYGGIMGYQVIDSTYKGEMPGPKSFGYFIGGMTLLSAATIYALGRTDKVFNAEGDSCQNCESPSTQTTSIVNKWGDSSEYKFCGDGCEGQYMRENKMSYDAQGLSQFTPNELTQSSAIHGDFDHASLNYSGHQNMILKAEDEEVYYLITFNHINGEYETTSRTIISENESMKSDRDIIAYQFGDDNPIDEGYKGYYSVHDGEWIRVDSKKSMSKKRKKMFNDYGLYAESFSAEGNYNDFIEDMEGVMGKYGEMKDFDSGYNPQDNLLKARMVVEVDDEDFDNVDFDAEVNSVMVSGSVEGEPAIFNYSKGITDNFGFTPGRIATGENTEELFAQYPLPDIPHHRNVKGFKNYKNNVWRKHMDAETMMPEKQCVICGEPYTGYGHNPEPIFPMSRGRCCDVCNATVVIPYRLGGMNFRFGEDFEAETARRFRNRFDKTQRGNPRNRAATGVKRNIWKNFFRKDAEDMADELDMVMAQLYEIEDMKNPTPEDLTNYQNLLTRYYEMVSFNAEQKTARVRTMSGKPVSETLRKLKQDKNLSAKDARIRKEIKAETFEAPKKSGRMPLSQLKKTLSAKDRKAFEKQSWRYWSSPVSIYNEQESYHQRITDRLKKNGFNKSRMSLKTMVKKIGPSAWTKFYNKWVAVGKSNFAYFGHPNLIVNTMLDWEDLLDTEIWTNGNKMVMVWQFKHHDHEDHSPWLEQTFTVRKEMKAENMEVFEAVSSNHDTYMKILSQVIKNYNSSSASKDAQLINEYGLTTMKRFIKWSHSFNFPPFSCFTEITHDWLEGDEISYREEDFKEIKKLLRNLTDEKARYELATIIAKQDSDLARIYEWTTDSQHKDVISLDEWDEDQFVLDFLATEEETENYYTQERLTLGSKNVSMILNLGDYEDEDDEATFFDELSPRSGKIPRNLPNTTALLDYLETNAANFEDMLHNNEGLRNFKILRDLYGWSFAIHPAQKYIYEEDDEIYIEWQLKRAIPAKKRQQIKLDAQKQIREGRAKLFSLDRRG